MDVLGALTRRVILLVSMGACVLVGAPPPTLAEGPSREPEIKAAFLYNFIKFVDWPTEFLPDTSDTITICVLRTDTFGDALESLRGKTVKGRRLAIRRIEPGRAVDSCHVLFVGSSEEQRLSQVMQSVQRSSVLTVGETNEFLHSGGIINFVIERNKVHFEINLNSAERARLKLSSQLLGLATVVRQ